MAQCIRRAFSRNLALRAHSSLLNISCHHSVGSAAAAGPCVFASRRSLERPSAFDPFAEGRRGYAAKGKKSKGEADDGSAQVPDLGPIVKTSQSQMEAGIIALSRELSKLQTGRASSGMLDHIIVDTGGVKLPLNRVAVVSVLDINTISVMPYDPSSLKAIESAIVSSALSLNPVVDGERLIVNIPKLTKESLQALCKVVTKSAEDVKLSIRRARQKALDTMKKVQSSIPKDDAKRLEKEVEELTKRFVKTADDMCKAKEKEIGGVGH